MRVYVEKTNHRITSYSFAVEKVSPALLVIIRKRGMYINEKEYVIESDTMNRNLIPTLHNGYFRWCHHTPASKVRVVIPCIDQQERNSVIEISKGFPELLKHRKRDLKIFILGRHNCIEHIN